jgi:hypothetical protein
MAEMSSKPDSIWSRIISNSSGSRGRPCRNSIGIISPPAAGQDAQHGGIKCAALVAAGYWAFYKFGVTEAPQLAETLNIGDKLEQARLGQTTACDFKLTISIDNKYKSPVDIKRVHARLWFFDFPELTQNVTFFDFREVEKSDPAWELPPGADQPLAFKMHPSQSASYQFDIFVRKPEKSYVYHKITVDSEAPAISKAAFDSGYSRVDCT